MPARSEAQRRYLAVHFGSGWMRKHHFNNKGSLPARSSKPKGKQPSRASIRRDDMIRNFQRKHPKSRHGR